MIPKHAEQFLRSDFVEQVEGPLSQLVPGRRTASKEAFFCPMCGLDNAVPNDGAGGCTSTRCDARWHVQGNAMHLWRSTVGHPVRFKTG